MLRYKTSKDENDYEESLKVFKECGAEPMAWDVHDNNFAFDRKGRAKIIDCGFVLTPD